MPLFWKITFPHKFLSSCSQFLSILNFSMLLLCSRCFKHLSFPPLGIAKYVNKMARPTNYETENRVLKSSDVNPTNGNLILGTACSFSRPVRELENIAPYWMNRDKTIWMSQQKRWKVNTRNSIRSSLQSNAAALCLKLELSSIYKQCQYCPQIGFRARKAVSGALVQFSLSQPRTVINADITQTL